MYFNVDLPFFLQEQELYQREGLGVNEVHYVDNQDCIGGCHCQTFVTLLHTMIIRHVLCISSAVDCAHRYCYVIFHSMLELFHTSKIYLDIAPYLDARPVKQEISPSLFHTFSLSTFHGANSPRAAPKLFYLFNMWDSTLCDAYCTCTVSFNVKHKKTGLQVNHVSLCMSL